MYNAHTDPLFVQLNLLKITDILALQELKFAQKLMNGSLPEYYKCNYIKQKAPSRYAIRNEMKYELLRVEHE